MQLLATFLATGEALAKSRDDMIDLVRDVRSLSNDTLLKTLANMKKKWPNCIERPAGPRPRPRHHIHRSRLVRRVQCSTVQCAVQCSAVQGPVSLLAVPARPALRPRGGVQSGGTVLVIKPPGLFPTRLEQVIVMWMVDSGWRMVDGGWWMVPATD